MHDPRSPEDAAAPLEGSTWEAREAGPVPGFALESEGAPPIVCRDVRGFGEALSAARDPRAPAPQRLVIVAPDHAMAAWLDTWAEDAERVRRAVVVRRRVDAAGVSAVATLASHGYGVPTSLAVESISTGDDRDMFLRSGVHPKVDVAAALARLDRGEPDPGIEG
jgi:hypothetical protein